MSPAPGRVAVDASGVARSFGSVHAVVDASIRVEAGRAVGLIGPNGCGKTTLMLMLAGLLVPDAGQISIAGSDPMRDGTRARTAVGWMPDQLGTWDSISCLDSLMYFGMAYARSAADARETGRGLLALVHLEEFADRPTRVLSRGQKQRLSLARALVNDPPVVMLDEPANGLDPRSRIELRDIVRDLAAEGRAVLVSSHVLTELEEMVDDVVFMSAGRTLGDTTHGVVAEARQRYGISALNPERLAQALAHWGIEAEAGPARTTLRISDETAAAELLAALIGAGVQVTAFAPLGGALEQAYLSLNEERR